jgi:syntaxin-binding protein 5
LEESSEKVSRLELLLHGPFADLLLVPCPSSTQMAALLLLTSPGQLHLYDDVGIATCFSAENRDTSTSSLQPVAWPTPIAEATAAKFELIPQDSAVASTLCQVLQENLSQTVSFDAST